MPLAGATKGAVAEWLRSGLQSRVHRFESGPRLQNQFRSSSAVEQAAVNRKVGGSNPSSGAISCTVATH